MTVGAGRALLAEERACLSAKSWIRGPYSLFDLCFNRTPGTFISLNVCRLSLRDEGIPLLPWQWNGNARIN